MVKDFAVIAKIPILIDTSPPIVRSMVNIVEGQTAFSTEWQETKATQSRLCAYSTLSRHNYIFCENSRIPAYIY